MDTAMFSLSQVLVGDNLNIPSYSKDSGALDFLFGLCIFRSMHNIPKNSTNNYVRLSQRYLFHTLYSILSLGISSSKISTLFKMKYALFPC